MIGERVTVRTKESFSGLSFQLVLFSLNIGCLHIDVTIVKSEGRDDTYCKRLVSGSANQMWRIYHHHQPDSKALIPVSLADFGTVQRLTEGSGA